MRAARNRRSEFLREEAATATESYERALYNYFVHDGVLPDRPVGCQTPDQYFDVNEERITKARDAVERARKQAECVDTTRAAIYNSVRATGAVRVRNLVRDVENACGTAPSPYGVSKMCTACGLRQVDKRFFVFPASATVVSWLVQKGCDKRAVARALMIDYDDPVFDCLDDDEEVPEYRALAAWIFFCEGILLDDTAGCSEKTVPFVSWVKN